MSSFWKYPLRVLQNRLDFVPKPSWCTFLVCTRCNATCEMCDSWQLPKGKELTVNEVARVFEKLGSLDVVRLSGGEPFLREDLLRLAESIMRLSNPQFLHITTNGSFPDRIMHFARSFSEPSKLQFMVSLDGGPNTHDQNRGKSATYAKAMQTVKELAIGRARGYKVSINHTIINMKSLNDSRMLREEAAKLGVEVQSVLAYSESATYSEHNQGKVALKVLETTDYPLHQSLDPSAAQDFVEAELTRVNDMSDPALRQAKRYYLRGLRERLQSKANPQPKPKCVALRSHIRLRPNGDVQVCQFNSKVVGNLLTQSLREVWENAGTNSERAWVDACKGCWAECEVMPNAIYSGDILSPRHLLK